MRPQTAWRSGLIQREPHLRQPELSEERLQEIHSIFQRIVREYPQSPLAAQSKTWIGVLSVIERSKEADIEIEQTKKKLSR